MVTPRQLGPSPRFAWLAGTGMRIGEALALEVGDLYRRSLGGVHILDT